MRALCDNVVSDILQPAQDDLRPWLKIFGFLALYDLYKSQRCNGLNVLFLFSFLNANVLSFLTHFIFIVSQSVFFFLESGRDAVLDHFCKGRDPSAELLLPSVAAERALHRETSRAQNLVALPQLTRLRRAVFFLKFVHHIRYLQC